MCKVGKSTVFSSLFPQKILTNSVEQFINKLGSWNNRIRCLLHPQKAQYPHHLAGPKSANAKGKDASFFMLFRAVAAKIKLGIV